MDAHSGFDMVPRLSNGLLDRHNWARFIESIKDHYKDNVKVTIKPNYIEFEEGEHLLLPFEGHKLLSFGSRLSGADTVASNEDSYAATVTRIASVHFGSRVKCWSEYSNQSCHYDWDEVKEAIRSYGQPDEIEIPTGIAHLLSGSDPIKELDSPLFEIKEIPGKGKGLITRFNLSKGTRILCERPLLILQSMPPNKLELVLAQKLKELAKVRQRQFLSLHNNFPGRYPFGGIVKTNALPCGSGSSVGGVYPTISLINHSCLPNSHNNWNSNEEHETIHAIRPIKAGEEITISYDQGGPSRIRQLFLKESFGFDCNCNGCFISSSELQASDARRLQIQSLDKAIGDPFGMMKTPNKSLRNCKSLLQVLREEYDGCAGALDARLYYDAFQISVAHGDEARASTFADSAYNARVICEGEDSPETQKVKSLALKPANHPSLGALSTKWKTTRNTIPKGLNTEQFEKWLWRETVNA